MTGPSAITGPRGAIGCYDTIVPLSIKVNDYSVIRTTSRQGSHFPIANLVNDGLGCLSCFVASLRMLVAL